MAPVTADALEPVAPEHARRPPSAMTVVIVSLMVITTLHLGRVVVLPVVIAILLTLTLSAPVRWLGTKGVPERVAAGLVVFGTVGVGVGGAALLFSPTMEWIASAPATMQKLESKVRKITMPLTAFAHSADRMEQATATAAADAPRTVQIATPGILARVSLETVAALPIALTVVFLTYFLLASGALFRRKLAGLFPGRQLQTRREHLVSQIEVAASHFLVTVVVVNTGVGIATALALWAVGVPSPLLWGAVAAILTFVPYLGPIVITTVIALASLAAIDDPARALLAPAAYVVIHLIEAYFVTPTLLWRHLPVNAVAIFLGLLFFGWMWGIPGAVLAVPLTVCAKLVCDHVPALAHVGELLDD